MRFLALLVFLALAGPNEGQAGDRLMSGIIAVKASEKPGPLNEALVPFEESILHEFPRSEVRLLGKKTRPLRAGNNLELHPASATEFRIHCLARLAAAYWVDIEWISNGKSLVRTRAKLARKAPLYIVGPVTPSGQIVAMFAIP